MRSKLLNTNMAPPESRYNEYVQPEVLIWSNPLADDNLYKAEYVGSGTFLITKPKRKANKKRLTKVKNPQRGARR